MDTLSLFLHTFSIQNTEVGGSDDDTDWQGEPADVADELERRVLSPEVTRTHEAETRDGSGTFRYLDGILCGDQGGRQRSRPRTWHDGTMEGKPHDGRGLRG